MKTVVITGASRGIGAETAILFAEKGYNVVVNYLKEDKKALEVKEKIEAMNKGKVLLVKADVSSLEGAKFLTEKAISVFGGVDVLVCNAGICHYNLLIDESKEDIQNVINTNLLGVIYPCKEASKIMMQNQKGKIINVSSMWGLKGASNETIYSASKGGVIAFTKALAKELGLSNINVNCVAPGVILTDMVNSLGEETLNDLASQTSLNRLGTTKDVANVIYFLASENSNYITGQVISVDGMFE